MEAVLDEVIFSISNPFGAFIRHAKKGFLHIHDHFVPHPRNNYIPHILGRRSLALASLLLLSVKVGTIVLLTAGPILPAYSSAITTENVFSLSNQSRQNNGLEKLSYNQVLAAAAQKKAQALLECGCFQHNLPDGRTPWDFIKEQKYNYLVAGENLAVDFTQAETVEEAWMNSPGHRANILNKNYEEIGVGIAEGNFQGHNAIFVVQMFGTPLGQPIKPLDAPTFVASQNKLEVPPAELTVAAPKTATLVAGQASLQPSPGTSLDMAVPIQVNDGFIEIKDGQAKIFVTTSGQVSKVTANFSGEAILLQPKSDTAWEGSVDVSKLTDANKTVSITATDMAGNSAGKILAGFSANVASNYNLDTSAKPQSMEVLGWKFDPKQLENKFYLFFAAGLLTCLALAIAVRHHVQHLSMVANGAFVAIAAMLLFIT